MIRGRIVLGGYTGLIGLPILFDAMEAAVDRGREEKCDDDGDDKVKGDK